MLNDFRAAIRSLCKSPSFTLPALGVLALGIGIASAIFSVVDGVVLRGLPFDDADRIVTVVEHDTRAADTLGGGLTSAPTFLDWRRFQTPFEHLAAARDVAFRTRTSSGEPVDAMAQSVTWEFFPVLRVAPVLGRAFGPDDEVRGRHRVVVLGHAYWQQQFGGAADAVGRTLDLNGEPWQIIGVAPPGFTYPVGGLQPTDLYVPLAFDDAERSRDSGHGYFYTALGRLRPGVAVTQADREIARLAAILDRQHPDWSPGRTARVLTLQDRLVGRVRSWMLMLLAAVGLVLVVACANVANLMLVRAITRSHDTSVRAALGASRWQLVRGPLTEALTLALAGAVAGVGLAHAGVRVLRAWLPFGLPRVATITVDWPRPRGAATPGSLSPGGAGARARRDAGRADNAAAPRGAAGGEGGHSVGQSRPAVHPDVFTLDDYMDRLIGHRRFLMALTAMLGLLGLVIATAGVYGVMAYAVTQQTGEIGLRVALGATPGRVIARVMGQAAALLAAGLAIGGVAAWCLGATVRAFLFGVQPGDPRVFVAALGVLALAGLLASALPARRAAGVDPLVALRHE